MAKSVDRSPIFTWIIVLGACFVLILPYAEQFEAKFGLSQLMRWRGSEAPPKEVAVIAITENTAEKLGKSTIMTEWSRQVYAELIQRLQTMGVKTIVFDIFFSRAMDEQGDLKFAQAMENHGGVILFAYSDRTIHAVANEWFAEMDRIAEPLPIFREFAHRTAPFILPKVPAQVSSFVAEHEVYPPRDTMPVVALQHFDHARWTVLKKTGSKRFWYNFYGPPRTITTLSLENVLTRNLQTTLNLDGFTVFVGYSSIHQPDQDDGFQTAYTGRSGHDISGVELAATAFANLKDGTYVRKGPDLLWPVVTLLYAAASYLLARRKDRFVLPFLLVIAGSYVTIAYLLFILKTLWLPLLIPVFVITPVIVVYGYQNRLNNLRRQREALANVFGRYIPAKEIDKLIKNPQLKLAGEKLFGVCMATDAEGYTTVAEKLSTDELGELMHEYLAVVINPIRQSGGIISDVAGDGVIAVWPQLNRHNAYLTIKPVIDAIQDSVKRFNGVHPDTPLPTRIGVHAGELVLGHFGAADHYEYRAIGDIVNTASRIEGANKKLGTYVLISGACLANALNQKEAAELGYLGRFRLPGKANVLPLYTLLAGIPEEFVEEKQFYNELHMAISQMELGNHSEARDKLIAIEQQYPENKILKVLLQTFNDPERSMAAGDGGVYLG